LPNFDESWPMLKFLAYYIMSDLILWCPAFLQRELIRCGYFPSQILSLPDCSALYPSFCPFAARLCFFLILRIIIAPHDLFNTCNLPSPLSMTWIYLKRKLAFVWPFCEWFEDSVVPYERGSFSFQKAMSFHLWLG
jgi:hypothetical protein